MNNTHHIRETLKKETIIGKLFTSAVFLVVFLLSIFLVDSIVIKCLVCALSFYIVLYNLTSIIVVYFDIKIEYWKHKITSYADSILKDMIHNKKEYNKKFIETVEFNDTYKLLISSTDVNVVKLSCDFFRNYNRFGCKDSNNEFIILLFAYVYYVEKLDEKHLLIHRNNIN